MHVVVRFNSGSFIIIIKIFFLNFTSVGRLQIIGDGTRLYLHLGAAVANVCTYIFPALTGFRNICA